MTSRAPNPRRGILLGAVASTCAAAFMIPWKLAAVRGDIAHLVFVLVTCAAILNTLGSVVPMVRSPQRPRGMLMVVLALIMGVCSVLGNTASATATSLLSAPIVAVLLQSQVVLVGCMGWVFMGERVPPREWWGIAVAMIGLVVLQEPFSRGDGSGLFSSVTVEGTLLALGAATCFATITLLTRRFRASIEPVFINALRLWCGVGYWLVFEGPLERERLTLELVLLGCLAAVFGPTLSRTLMIYAVREVPARVVAIMALLTPPQTLILAWLILDDVPSPTQLAGGALMLLGIGAPLLPTRPSE